MTGTCTIRSAHANDEATIKALIHAEQLDPLNVHWQNFLVAEEAGRIIGIGQVKLYPSGRELGSLVVVADRRQNGVGGAIINALIARERGPLRLFCLAFREPYYAKFGFRRCGLRDLPGEFKLKYALGTLFTRLVGRRLIVMQRFASAEK
ncbi:MAG TPA: GNAT family N-acetyltransferase [Anaerolineae bacterium]|nr:GNAT family N-acetyltransferase [Anaerolineae bacterium]